MSRQLETIIEGRAPFLVGDWLVEPTLNRLSRDGEAVQLELKAMDVLISLAAHAGDLVGKTELLDEVWETEFVSDNTLTRRVAQLRDALGDDAKSPRYIETITKKGYRLIAPVEPVAPATADVSGFPVRSEDSRDLEDEGEGRPYPGLSPFSELEAEDFFGREEEVSALWRKITSRRLLAVIGPSGVGKSSLIRAGLVPVSPDGWRTAVCEPGNAPFLALARALAPDFAGEVGEVQQLLGFADPDVALATVSRWRGLWHEAVIVIDQFEELFTLNPPDVQARFVSLLRRAVDAADVHLVLVLRDDFLYDCHRFPELSPIFKDLTLVNPLAGAALRRAIVEPAARRLYGFESALLVDEMLDAVVEERGALPLLAFAVSRLWQLRDRDRRLLTREGYELIGGVAGALAQHAEATVEGIGAGRLPVVRELFRNLVTAKGTRASREVGELLSVFDEEERSDAEDVLGSLVASRLLNAFHEEAGGEESRAVRRVEIVHESLLSAWPRLVRWQTQDADAAQLRDQLRQAAVLWDDTGRPRDLLWSGSSYRQFTVWRESYPGGLSTVEEAFADAMEFQVGRKRTARRAALFAGFASVVAVATVTTTLWWNGVREFRRAEASALFRYGQSIVDRYPHGALGAALTSLELVDDPEVRQFAVQALQRGPKGRFPHQSEPPISVEFSPDGAWLASGNRNGTVHLHHESGGDPKRVWQAHEGSALVRFGPRPGLLWTVGLGDGLVHTWSVPDGILLETVNVPAGFVIDAYDPADLGVVQDLVRVVAKPGGDRSLARSWWLEFRPFQVFRSLREVGRATSAALDPTGRFLAIVNGHDLHLLSVWAAEPARRLIGRSDEDLERVTFHPSGEIAATVSDSGRAALWSTKGDSHTPLRAWRGWRESAFWNLRFDPTGSWLVANDESGNSIVWGVNDPPDAEPLHTITAMDRHLDLDFHRSGKWLVHTATNGVGVYPFDRDRFGWVFRGHEANVEAVSFTPDGRWLVSASLDGMVRRWSLGSGANQGSPVLGTLERVVSEHLRLSVAPDGSFVAVTSTDDAVHLMWWDGSPETVLEGLHAAPSAVAIGPDSRTVAAAGGGGLAGDRATIIIWELTSGRSSVLARDLPGPITDLHIERDGAVLASVGSGVLRRFDPVTGTDEEIADEVFRIAISSMGDRVISLARFEPALGAAAMAVDLESGMKTPLLEHGRGLYSAAISDDGELVVTGGKDRVVRVGASTGEVPHLLFGHDGMIHSVAVSPDGRWVASGSRDRTVRLWRVPTGTPIQSLPIRQFLDRMWQDCHYVYRRNPDAAGGFVSEMRPFVGWGVLPTQ